MGSIRAARQRQQQVGHVDAGNQISGFAPSTEKKPADTRRPDTCSASCRFPAAERL
jgi:hypothetical protein